MRSFFFWLFLVFMQGGICFAQQNNWTEQRENPNLGNPSFMQMKIHGGSHLYTGESLSAYLEKGYLGFEFRYGKYTTGKRDWEKAWNQPMYGIGLYSGYLGDRDVLGNPSGIYVFFHHPFLRRKKHHFDWEWALGLTYDLNPYDPVLNPDNDAIGSKTTVYFNVNIGGNLKIDPRFDFTYGIDLTHFSNGRTFTPNYGLNMFGLNAGLRYNFNPNGSLIRQIEPTLDVPYKTAYIGRTLSPYKKYHAISIFGSLGTVQHQIPGEYGPRYGTWSFVADYNYRYGYTGSFTGGFDIFYDGSLAEKFKSDQLAYTYTDLMQIGIHLGHSVHMGQVSIETQIGTYLYQKGNYKGSLYARIGIRYMFKNGIFPQISLKTLNGFAADWIEWGVGYRFYREK